MKSQLFSLDVRDILKGAIVAFLGASLGLVQVFLKDKGLDWNLADFQEVLWVGLTAFAAYLTKNFFTDENDRLGGRY